MYCTSTNKHQHGTGMQGRGCEVRSRIVQVGALVSLLPTLSLYLYSRQYLGLVMDDGVSPTRTSLELLSIPVGAFSLRGDRPSILSSLTARKSTSERHL